MPETKRSFFGTVMTGSAVVGGFTIASQAAALLTTLVVLKSLPVFDYGLWRLLLSVVSAVSLITLPSLDSLIIADMGSEVGRKDVGAFRGMLRGINVTLAIATCVAIVAMCVAAPIISTVTHFNITKLLWILALSLPGAVADRVYGYTFSTHLYFKRAQMMDTVNRLFYLAIIIGYGMLYGFSVYTVVVAYTAASLVTALVFLPVYLHAISYAKRTPAKPYSASGMLRGHGKWALASGCSDTLSNSFKTWITGYFLGVEVLGIFSAATALLSALSNLVPLTQVLSFVLPRESHDKPKLVYLFERSLKYSMWIYAALAVAAVIGAPILISALLPKYAPAVPLLLVMLVSFVGIPIGNLTNNLLTIYRSQREQFLSNLFMRVITVFLELPLALFFFGIGGAVFDQIFTTYLFSVIRIYLIDAIHPEFKIRMRSWFSFDDADREFVGKIVSSFRARLSL